MIFIIILGSLIIYCMACTGLGYFIIQILRFATKNNLKTSPITDLSTTFLLGSGFLANIWVIFTSIKWFSPEVIALFVLLFVIPFGIYIRKVIREIQKQATSILVSILNETWEWKVLIGLVLLSCLIWITSLGRPLSGDGVSFYMTMAKLIAYTHQLIKVPTYENFSSVGLQGEMHYAAFLSFNIIGAAKLFTWITILAGTIQILALARYVGLKRKGQWLVTAFIFSSTAVTFLIGSGKTDLTATAFGLAAYYWTAKYVLDRDHLSLWLAGFFLGLSFIAKISYLPILGFGIPIFIAWSFYNNPKVNLSFRNLLLALSRTAFHLSLALFITITPHLLKNKVLYDNPFAPYNQGSIGWLNHSYIPDYAVKIIHLTYPLQLIFGDNWAQLGNLSPLVLAFLPLTLLTPRLTSKKTSNLTPMTVTCILSIIVWVMLNPYVFGPRFILASLLLLFLPVADACERIHSFEKNPKWISGAIVFFTCLTLIAVGFFEYNRYFHPINAYLYATGKLNDCMLHSDVCELIENINSEAQPGERVFMFTHQRFFLRADLIQCIDNSDEIASFSHLDYPEQRWNYLLNRGFKYLLFDSSDTDLITLLNVETPPANVTVTQRVDNGIILLKFESTDLNHVPGTSCIQSEQMLWKVHTL